MNCPKCGSGPKGPGKVWLVNADYGYGHGAEYKCHNHPECPDGYRFVVHSAEAKAESDAQRAVSRANADRWREYTRRRDAGEIGLQPPWDGNGTPMPMDMRVRENEIQEYQRGAWVATIVCDSNEKAAETYAAIVEDMRSGRHEV